MKRFMFYYSECNFFPKGMSEIVCNTLTERYHSFSCDNLCPCNELVLIDIKKSRNEVLSCSNSLLIMNYTGYENIVDMISTAELFVSASCDNYIVIYCEHKLFACFAFLLEKYGKNISILPKGTSLDSLLYLFKKIIMSLISFNNIPYALENIKLLKRVKRCNFAELNVLTYYLDFKINKTEEHPTTALETPVKLLSSRKRSVLMKIGVDNIQECYKHKRMLCYLIDRLKLYLWEKELQKCLHIDLINDDA